MKVSLSFRDRDSQKSVSVLWPRLRLGNSWWSRLRLGYEQFSRLRPLVTVPWMLEPRPRLESLTDLCYESYPKYLNSDIATKKHSNLRDKTKFYKIWLLLCYSHIKWRLKFNWELYQWSWTCATLLICLVFAKLSPTSTQLLLELS